MDKKMICGYEAYPLSVQTVSGQALCMVSTPQGDQLLAQGSGLGFAGQAFEYEGARCTLAPLSHENALRLRQLLPFTAPRAGLNGTCSIGVGDRLGIATPGHLRVFKRWPKVFPILAQQSIRELNLTGRTYEEVLDSATFAVFREGYTTGWGADGDHLKKPEEIRCALDCGFSMITLDCSEYIRNDVQDMSGEEAGRAYEPDRLLESLYLEQVFTLKDGTALRFGRAELIRAVLIYGKALQFMQEMYERFLKGKALDFEISIDETLTPTSPLQHFFVASELTRAGVRFQSLAPRFCGEFQKGIDYIGDLAQFNAELDLHAAIAGHFGYKLSVHSGSDKFSVFPAVGRATHGVFHLKTAGTNWLEAVRLVAMKDPALYRRVLAFALNSFKAASAYYHVNSRPENIPDLKTLRNAELPGLMDHNDARQVLHITYGLILTARAPDGSRLFKDALYALWAAHQEEYAQLLDGHIGRHVELLFSQVET